MSNQEEIAKEQEERSDAEDALWAAARLARECVIVKLCRSPEGIRYEKALMACGQVGVYFDVRKLIIDALRR